MKIIGLRFFTVYGSGVYLYVYDKIHAILKIKKDFNLYNFGNHKRDLLT